MMDNRQNEKIIGLLEYLMSLLRILVRIGNEKKKVENNEFFWPEIGRFCEIYI